MTSTYALLLPGNEDRWAEASEEERQTVYGLHREFARLLEERGHKIAGGAELGHSKNARVVRGTVDKITVTEGPYAETVEQLTGFYLVTTDDPDDLLQVAGLLADTEGVVEVRQVVDSSAAEVTA